MLLPKTKLKNQLTLVNAFSKGILILLAIFVIPGLVRTLSIKETDNQLVQKLDQVYDLIETNGIEAFVNNTNDTQGFGSYNILKEEYISIEKTQDSVLYEYIQDQERDIDGEVYDYRVISATFSVENQVYLLEIGKSIFTIISFEKKLQSFAFYLLLFLLSISIFIDLSIARILLKPFGRIIEKLKSTRHPKEFDYSIIQTPTTDFNYLQEGINQLMKQIDKTFDSEREYIGNVSHELLTPISIIRSKLDNFTSSTNLNAREMQKIFEIKTTVSRLTKMVRSLLLLSRIENKEYLRNENISLPKLLKNTIEEFEDRAEIKQQKLILISDSKIPNIEGNKELMQILLNNLVSNALKYTAEKGKIAIKLQAEKEQLLLEVSDNGKGISKEAQDHIFDRFKKYGTQKESFGLGLALVKQIADYHKIKINLESEPKVGTVFRLHIPLK